MRLRNLAVLRHLVFTGLGFIALASDGVTTAAAQTPPNQPPSEKQTSANQAPTTAQRYRFRVLGVYDEASGEPVEGVEVSDLMSGASARTTKTGTVSLFFLPDGGSLVRLKKIGYEMQTFSVPITPADTAPVTVVLSKAVQLATVNVKAAAPKKYLSSRLNAAEERIHSHAGGYFIDEDEMRKHDNSTLAMLLPSRMPGMMTAQGKRGATYLLSSRKPCATGVGCSHPNCFIHIFIDGIEGTGAGDVGRMSPWDYAIAEFYPGGASVPIEYGGSNASCGVLLLWTRER